VLSEFGTLGLNGQHRCEPIMGSGAEAPARSRCRASGKARRSRSKAP